MKKIVLFLSILVCWCGSIYAGTDSFPVKKGRWKTNQKIQVAIPLRVDAEQEYISNSIMVRFSSNATQDEIDQFYTKYNLKNAIYMFKKLKKWSKTVLNRRKWYR